MSQVTASYIVCDYCKGAIPGGADCISGISGNLVVGGTVAEAFQGVDFCCSDHLVKWVEAIPLQIPIPSPLYSPPPTA